MLLRAVRCAPRSSAGLARRLVNCAAQYRTKPEWLADNTEDVECEILYVVGGLYGNAFALEALRTVLKAEIAKNPENDIAVVFNGDFNFFNATPEAWVAINAAVHGRVSEGMGGRVHAFATRGNVEAEVSAAVCVPDAVIGCGCAYPKKAGPALEANATAIVQQLHAAACEADAAGHEWIAPWLKSLPFTRTFQVGDARVAAIHGDATCVNGWRFAADALESGPPRNGQLLDATLSSWLERAEVDIFASTHTCLPVFKKLEQGECAKVAGQCTSTKGGIVANNGAAGMGNFERELCGIVTRIAIEYVETPVEALYATWVHDVTVEAIPLHFDVQKWLDDDFLPRWPPGSAAHDAYYDRIVGGVVDWFPRNATKDARAPP